MLDIKFIRQNPDKVKDALLARGTKFDLEAFLALDEKRRTLQRQVEDLAAKQNKIDKEIQKLLQDKKDPKPKIAESKSIKEEIAAIEGKFNELDKQLKEGLDRIPNIPHCSLPVGGAAKNKIVRESGILRSFDFKTSDHITLAEHLDIIDFKRAAKITGSNFLLFKGKGAQLERALINFMLDLHTGQHQYTEIFPAKLVNRQSMRATGQLPNLEEDMYCLKDEDLFLIPTAEVPVTNIYRDEVLEEEQLPVYYVAYTPCFRREAGSYGKDTRGLSRVHEFDKVEMVKFVKPENSYDELEKLLDNACSVLDLLKIPYRVVILATGDLSFAAAKCYDIEIYAPGVDKWLEVSSCSNFEDFQARRANIKYRTKTIPVGEPGVNRKPKTEYVHTLNGSGVALARLVAALLENYQEKDGSVTIPEVLRKYMNGLERMVR